MGIGIGMRTGGCHTSKYQCRETNLQLLKTSELEAEFFRHLHRILIVPGQYPAENHYKHSRLQ